MGASDSKAPCTIADSPSEGGVKCVLSEPLDDFLTADKYWELYEKQCRAGFTMPTMGKIFGGSVDFHEVTDQPDGSFKVESKINGGYFGPGVYHIFLHYSFDKHNHECTSARYVGGFEEQKLQEKTTTKLLMDPLRVEAWSDAMRQRATGQDVSDILSSLLKIALTRAGVSKTDVKATPDSPSPGGSGLCALSEPLDASLTPQTFWEHWSGMIKDGIQRPNQVEHKVEDLPKGNWVVVHSYKTGQVDYEKFVFDEENNKMEAFNHEDDSKMDDWSCDVVYTTVLHKDPLRIEFYRETAPGRKVTRQLMGLIQNAVDTCIMDANGRGSWFS